MTFMRCLYIGMLSDPSPGRDGEEGKMAMRKLVRRATEKLQKIRRVARNNSGTAKEKTSSYGQQQQMPYGGVQEAPEFIAEDNGLRVVVLLFLCNSLLFFFLSGL